MDRLSGTLRLTSSLGRDHHKLDGRDSKRGRASVAVVTGLAWAPVVHQRERPASTSLGCVHQRVRRYLTVDTSPNGRGPGLRMWFREKTWVSKPVRRFRPLASYQRPRVVPPTAVFREAGIVGQCPGPHAECLLLVGIEEGSQPLGQGRLHEVAQILQHR